MQQKKTVLLKTIKPSVVGYSDERTDPNIDNIDIDIGIGIRLILASSPMFSIFQLVPV